MAYYSEQSVEQPNWLASPKYTSFTQQFTADANSGDVATDANGKTIGIVLNDVRVPRDQTGTAVTDATIAAAVLVSGFVIKANLPAATQGKEADLVALGIKFRDDLGAVPAAAGGAA